jgi:predicted outer membrane repeat protein
MRKISWAVLVATASLLLGPHLLGNVFTIANGDVAGLKNAIAASNINGEDDTIELATNGTYTITARDNSINGLPRIQLDGGHQLTIHGNGSTIQRSTAGGTLKFRIFYINSGANVAISGLILANGNITALAGSYGGGIYSDGESGTVNLSITDCTFNSNFADYGGALYNDGESGLAAPSVLVVANSTFTGNGANYAGAIFNDGAFGSAMLNVNNCTFSGNSASISSGSIQHDAFMGSATGSFINCTFDHNTATQYGGAVGTDGDSGSVTLTVKNCTFNGNSAGTSGGGIDNSGGGAILQVANTIFKTGANGANLSNEAGTITSQGHNLSNDNGAGFLTAAGDKINTDPMLDPAGLVNNGGPTQTIALQAGSMAIDAGNDANAPERDQRYYQRNGVSDIGAFEFGGTLAPTTAGSGKTHGAAGSFTINFPLTGTVGVECRTSGAGGSHQLVMPFATPVTVGGASVTSGIGSVSSFVVNGSSVTVNLTGIANAQQIAVTLSNVNDGTHTNNVIIPMRFLLGDTTGNSSVNASDVTQGKQGVGQALTNANFRRDVNANGTINATDVTIIKAQVGMAIP